ncbi:MAG TPA: hypothetical protein VK667_03685 [Ktedonobacteraceae bacterium]|nr:hypothetical protein [Ktedonobacteraceae bacterium]
MAFPNTANRVADMPDEAHIQQEIPRTRRTRNKEFLPGQRRRNQDARGGGGPANAGAHTEKQGGMVVANTEQPSWAAEFSDQFIGKAAPSRIPVTAGIKANNFRGLGDDFGGRQ